MCQVFILEVWDRTPNIPRGIYNVETGNGVGFLLANFLLSVIIPAIFYQCVAAMSCVIDHSLHSQLYHHIDSNQRDSSDRH